ncbi:hypothetical protein [Roseomonas sp. 18066]|uniref:hypothetical protein n=1 Tax=Roseomonas sp. 18066 TaxID=2681412 RepID=UPI00135BC372|nr:hypothetical protein [Roseomonas sp. 18066]
MTDAPDRMAGLARPMQHALNNLFMVLHANMDSVLSGMPEGDKTTIRLQRASTGARDLELLLRAYFRLGRPQDQNPVDSGKFVEAVRPVLAQAVGKLLPLEVRSTTAITPTRPELDLALLDLAVGAKGLPLTTKPALALEGAVLIANWPAPEEAVASLAALGLTVESSDTESRVTLG